MFVIWKCNQVLFYRRKYMDKLSHVCIPWDLCDVLWG